MFVVRRLLLLIPILFGVSLLTFALAKITPGDPARIVLGQTATPAQVAALRAEMGLDDPVLVQYIRFLTGALHGDLGRSFRGNIPVWDEIMARLPSTIELTIAGMGLAILIGIPAGIVAATARHRWIDRTVMLTAIVGISIPNFFFAIVLILIFGLTLRWVPVTGGQGLISLILPAIALAVGPAAVFARLTRSSILEVIREDYVRTARAKGLNERVINWRHVLRNALIPVVTLMGLQFAALLNGAVFLESVFARPGLGRFIVDAIGARDYPQIQGIVLFAASVYVVLNLLVDVSYALLDPRIRYQ